MRSEPAEALTELTAADIDTARVRLSYEEFARRIIPWNELTEKSYLNLRKTLYAQ